MKDKLFSPDMRLCQNNPITGVEPWCTGRMCYTCVFSGHTHEDSEKLVYKLAAVQPIEVVDAPT